MVDTYPLCPEVYPKMPLLYPNISSSLVTVSCRSSASLSNRPIRYAVLGAGFAGLSVAWHLLNHSSKELDVCIDIYDQVGIGGGASGVAGGLLHPYSPKVKLLWRGAECWKESLNLLNVAEGALFKLVDNGKQVSPSNSEPSIVKRRGILRPAVSLKNLDLMIGNSENCLTGCRIESIHEDAAQSLVPDISVPLNLAFYMPEALSINSQCYLEALYLACENLAEEMSKVGVARKELSLHKKSVESLLELAGGYNAIIICLGARAAFLPELSGRLPLRMCRGLVTHLQLTNDIRKDYPVHSPSILSDVWLSVQGARSIHMGSTWEWKSSNYSRDVSMEEAAKAMEVLLPKASAVYPPIKEWTITGAMAGLRAMPPLSADGSLPILGCIDNLVGGGNNGGCKYWLFTGLGARGLLFHGWLGKLMAQAVLSCDEGLIPSELTSWKYSMQQQ